MSYSSALWHVGAARASRPLPVSQARPALPLAAPATAAASGTGHLTRPRPQDSASNAAAPQWEPRTPLGGTRKPRRSGASSGARVRFVTGFGPSWATYELRPLKLVTQADYVICPQVSDARQAGAVTTGRAPVHGWRAPVLLASHDRASPLGCKWPAASATLAMRSPQTALSLANRSRGRTSALPAQGCPGRE